MSRAPVQPVHSLVTLGAHRVAEDPAGWGVAGHRIGLLTNDGARLEDEAGTLTRVALLEAGVSLVHLFAPEHGISALASDGLPLSDGTDAATGLPVTSLYGPRLRPDRETLDGLDLVLVDLPDVGARFYTFLWTLTHVMEACSDAGVPVLILDRPNPLGGREEWVEGPLPDPDAEVTFLGRWPIPVRHSLTLGEMASLFRAETDLPLELEVVPMEGWERTMLWWQTGLPFHPPSPGIPTPESALLYPGLALLESTNLLEGRGTPFAFRWLGAHWMEEDGGPEALVEEVNRRGAPGVLAKAHALSPLAGSDTCPGVLLEITDRRKVRPVALGLHLLAILHTLWPNRFSWTPYPTAVNPGGGGHLQRLLARRTVVESLEMFPGSLDRGTILEWTSAPGWWARATPHLLYG